MPFKRTRRDAIRLCPRRFSDSVQTLSGGGSAIAWQLAGKRVTLPVMASAPLTSLPVTASAPFDDLDLDSVDGAAEWERRVMEMANARIQAARGRLERLGIIDVDGQLVSTELTVDMLPDSDATLETG